MKRSSNVITLLIVAFVAIIGITVMLFAPAIVNNFSDVAGYATYPIYTSFSLPESRLNINGNTLSISDYAIYKTGYYSINGNAWQPFTLSGTILNGSWLNGNANANLPNFPTGESYIVIYSCSKTSGVWNCHDGTTGKWQLQIINNTANSSTSSAITWSGELLTNAGFEQGNTNGWTTSGLSWQVGIHPPENTQFATPQSGNYAAYYSGSSSINYYIYQDVDVSDYASSIDASSAIINASGWGVSSESTAGPDRTRIQILFLNSAKDVIETATDTDYKINDGNWWKAEVANYHIPVGTRYVRMWGNTYENCSCNSGSLDSFSVKIGYNGTAVTPPNCSNDCTTNGAKQCYGAGYRTCGNYDSDSCLEWSAVTSCNTGQTCTSGVCTTSQTCTDTCSSSGYTCGTQTICGKIVDCGTCSSTGTTHYISTSGSDSATGSMNSPWKTLYNACLLVKNPGDIIRVTTGTYNEKYQCNLNPGVSIEGEGSGSIITSNLGSYLIVLTSNPVTSGAQHISNIKMDGNTYSGYGAIEIYGRSNVEIHDCTFVNFQQYGVSYKSGTNDGNDYFSPPSKFATGNRFYNNVMTNCAGQIGGDDGNRDALEIDGQDGMLIYNNVITDNRPNGLTGNNIGGVTGYIKNVKIFNNTLHKTYVPEVTPWDFSMEFWNYLGGVEIYNNDIQGDIDVGGWSNVKGASTYSVWIHDNKIGQPVLLASGSTRGIIIEGANDGVIIEKNLIQNVASGVYLPIYTTKDQTNIRISYNIFSNIGAANGVSSQGWGIDWTNEVNGCKVENISVWNNVFKGISVGSNSPMWGIGLPGIGTAKSISIKNNIVTGFAYTPVFVNDHAGTNSVIDYLSIENNIFYNNGYNNAPRLEDLTITHYTQNNMIVDPSFVSISSGDYHLQQSSPAINKGANVGLGSDYDDNYVPSGNAPDIGVYETN